MAVISIKLHYNTKSLADLAYMPTWDAQLHYGCSVVIGGISDNVCVQC